MDLVVDANIVFATLIKENFTYQLIFRDKLHLFTPEFVFSELEEHKKEILDKTERTLEEFEQALEKLKRRIIIIPLEELVPYAKEAEIISPDPDDVAYVALALKFNCPIWSNDKPLKEKQNKITVYNTSEVNKL
jgi:predicted nucleic acid-binding protein